MKEITTSRFSKAWSNSLQSFPRNLQAVRTVEKSLPSNSQSLFRWSSQQPILQPSYLVIDSQSVILAPCSVPGSSRRMSYTAVWCNRERQVDAQLIQRLGVDDWHNLENCYCNTPKLRQDEAAALARTYPQHERRLQIERATPRECVSRKYEQIQQTSTDTSSQLTVDHQLGQFPPVSWCRLTSRIQKRSTRLLRKIFNVRDQRLEEELRKNLEFVQLIVSTNYTVCVATPVLAS